MNKMDRKQMHDDFVRRFQKMLDLVALGRGIEILIRIADQTERGLAAVDKSYESMITSQLRLPSLKPAASLPNLFADTEERCRVELARAIADKLAHGLYRQARKLIRKYRDNYGLAVELNSDHLSGWRIDADGHLIEDDGRRIESIVDTIKSSSDNLIVEEFDVFLHNNYGEAAKEIFKDAWRRLSSGEKALSIKAASLHMFRGFKRGNRTYSEE